MRPNKNGMHITNVPAERQTKAEHSLMSNYSAANKIQHFWSCDQVKGQKGGGRGHVTISNSGGDFFLCSTPFHQQVLLNVSY